MRGRVAERRGAVGGVQQHAGVALGAAAAPRRRTASSCSPKNASPRSSAVAKCVMRPASSTPGASAAAAATAVASAGSRVPSRPMPVSSFTWTRAAAVRADARDRSSSRQTTTSASGVQRDRQLLVAQRARGRGRGPSTPADAQLGRLGGRRDGEPGGAARQRGPRGRDHRRARSASALTTAQSAAPGAAARQARGVALDRAEVDPRERPDHPRLRGRAAELGADAPAAITSAAITPSTPRRSAAPHAGAGVQPHGRARRRARARCSRASSAPSTPLSTSPVPAVASAGVAAGLTSDVAAGVGDERVVALEHDDARPRAGRLPRVVQAPRADVLRRSTPSSRPSSPSCGVRTVGAGRAARSSSRPAWAFSPSASSTQRDAAPAPPRRARTPRAASLRPSPGPRTSAPPRAMRLGQDDAHAGGDVMAVLVRAARAASPRRGARPTIGCWESGTQRGDVARRRPASRPRSRGSSRRAARASRPRRARARS